MTVTILPAVEQLALLQQRKISALELAEEHIRQIERMNPALNAFIEFDADEVRTHARLVEKSTVGGPLAGLPLSVKATISVQGYRCEIGSALHRGAIAEQDAEAVSRLRSAGATLLGTTNCPEFLMAYETDNLLYGRTSNPWSLAYSSGGSSGGEAAAIAAGMSAGGLGSDSGGSVREPAHFCGISALKPTPGRIPGRGHVPPCVGPFSILGAVGPMARTVADVSLLFEVLAGQDILDPVSPPVPYRHVTLDDAKRIPIGWFEDDGLIPVTDETRAAVRNAAQALEQQGFHVERFRPAALEEARELWWKFFMQCGAMFYAPTITGREAELSPIFREFLELGNEALPLTAAQLLDAWAHCDIVRGKLLEEMRRFPILLLPVCSIPAFKHGERAWQIDGKIVRYLDAMRYTQWFNLLGAPAAVVPVGSSKDGLPIGVQIAGRAFEDELVLAVAACVERAFGFRAPPLINL
ncbi:amidase [Silvibacterium bohemicum]|uniref:Amidase n=1 Tax=Silvibacterium bohemicum TaxID=1577686 RepID=A0A841JTU2_9BACT|nr:amidase [Silvibacterium bohemicum]MBB6144822.1 amidase [Silvibacterium bohemicum]